MLIPSINKCQLYVDNKLHQSNIAGWTHNFDWYIPCKWIQNLSEPAIILMDGSQLDSITVFMTSQYAAVDQHHVVADWVKKSGVKVK